VSVRRDLNAMRQVARQVGHERSRIASPSIAR
jgi:hypothetical protein